MDIRQLHNHLANLQNAANAANTAARQAFNEATTVGRSLEHLRRENQQLAERFQQWGSDVAGMSMKTSIGAGAGRPDLLHIEDLPGRRVPFDVIIPVGIAANQSSPITQAYTLSMDGPFVAVARAATFLSSYTFQVTIGQETAQYAGRSFGRFRPVSSVHDIMDNIGGGENIPIQTLNTFECSTPTPPPTATHHIVANKSPFRTMEFDGYIETRNQTYPRQSDKVPSSLWAPGWEGRMDLPVLDYYEKGDVIEFAVEPSHVNNPPAGNIQALLGSQPYLESQYDSTEGILYPEYQCTAGIDDVVQRRPDGILYLHLIGFRILQPTGVAVR
jgi:hypothetical protein